MIDCRKSLMVCIGLLLCGTFSAQESEFDLALAEIGSARRFCCAG